MHPINMIHIPPNHEPEYNNHYINHQYFVHLKISKKHQSDPAIDINDAIKEYIQALQITDSNACTVQNQTDSKINFRTNTNDGSQTGTINISTICRYHTIMKNIETKIRLQQKYKFQTKLNQLQLKTPVAVGFFVNCLPRHDTIEDMALHIESSNKIPSAPYQLDLSPILCGQSTERLAAPVLMIYADHSNVSVVAKHFINNYKCPSYMTFVEMKTF